MKTQKREREYKLLNKIQPLKIDFFFLLANKRVCDIEPSGISLLKFVCSLKNSFMFHFLFFHNYTISLFFHF